MNYFNFVPVIERNMEEVLKSDGVVIIPTYNEKENVENIIRAVFDLPHAFDVLIIDDGSPDGTADIVKRLQADEFAGRLHLLERSGKLGLGTAYITGFKWAIAHGYDYVFEMTPISRTTPKTCRASTKPAPCRAPTWRSVRATYRA